MRNKLRNGGLLREEVRPREHADPDQDVAAAIALVQARFLVLEAEEARLKRAAIDHPLLQVVPTSALQGLIGTTCALGGLFIAGPIGLVLGLILGVIFAVNVGAGAPSETRLIERRRRVAASRLVEATRSVVRRNFVEAIDGMVFECAPHRTFLHARAADVVRTVHKLEARSEELLHLRNGLVDANERLGRPAEDEEVQAVDAERARIATQVGELKRLGVSLKQQIDRYDEAQTQLRLIATRRALSEKVGEVLERAPSDEARRAAAEIEVDILELEGTFEALELELSDADADLRAVLETAAVTRD
ncbi:MAG: hypothetical protein H6741_02665 [Alphaproteobacteria bacterium]|nr:hypothetical protein [Alphaproteobacteria bacterium]MCB9791607.1 hypothetical protein [Alphaproteobacteria bacterium]